MDIILTIIIVAFMETMRIFNICALSLLAIGTLDALTPDQAKEKLLKGNERYMGGHLENCESNQARRQELVAKQKPFAIILGCSDSRVPPEIIFDQGVGDLFVVRVAGNVVSRVELDSIDFGAYYLNAAAILVLGHEGCGAVKAVLDKNVKDIETVAALIEPAVARYRGQPDALSNAIKANVKAIVAQLKNAPVLAELIKQKKIDVYGGYYNLASGKVDLLD